MMMSQLLQNLSSVGRIFERIPSKSGVRTYCQRRVRKMLTKSLTWLTDKNKTKFNKNAFENFLLHMYHNPDKRL